MTEKSFSPPIRLYAPDREVSLRPIQPADDPQVAQLIRSVMTEYGAVGPGYSIEDPEVDHMCETYTRPGHAYWVLEDGRQILGGGGYGPLAGGEGCLGELRKMYFYASLRGRGLGRRLLQHCLDQARAAGYTHCYLESLSRMQEAERLYRRAGFSALDQPLGCTGHTACDTYFLKAL